jgi:hypothetical protein
VVSNTNHQKVHVLHQWSYRKISARNADSPNRRYVVPTQMLDQKKELGTTASAVAAARGAIASPLRGPGQKNH